tara:strand:+ start:1023 stop:1475 length:453 start_codon:yes stop_codon:yes gene_type:complete
MGIQKTVIIFALLLFSTPAVSEIPLVCLAKNIYFESRNQPWAGKIAVAQVTINRVQDERFPNNVCDVVHQQKRGICQFSWYCDGLSDNPKEKEHWEESVVIAKYVLSRKLPDITEGSLWYHTTSILPWWHYAYEPRVIIQDHIFYGPLRD